MKTIVPDYYPNFRCKCGECRHCCCGGWGITVSYVEYCRLLGVECSAELRKKLDCAFFILKDGDAERYAEIKMNYLGNCPLQREDGYCALQCECGEEVLPLICRMYPRNVLFPVFGEGACTNSCEKTVEMLFAEKNGISFTEIETDVLPTATDEKLLAVQKETLSLLRDRTLSLNNRLIRLGEVLGFKESDFDKKVGEEELFRDLLAVIAEIESFSPTFEQYSILAKEDLDILRGEFSLDYVARRYRSAKEQFKRNFPDYEIYFENVMNNHLFFERFPYSAKGETVFEKYAELCGIFSVLRFICVAYTETRPHLNDLADCVAGLFRCFEHTQADLAVRNSLGRMGKLSYAFIKEILEEF